MGREQAGGVVGGEVGIVEAAGQYTAPGKALGISEIRGVRILGNNGDRAEDTHRLRVVLVELKGSGDGGVEAGDGRSHAQRGTDQAVGTGARATGRNRRASRAGAHRSPESANASARRVLHDAGVDAQDVGPGFCAQQVRVSDVQVVTGKFNVEIVFQSQRNRVVDR